MWPLLNLLLTHAAQPLAACCCRGVLEVGSESLVGQGTGRRPANTFLATHGWGKGIAWVNGFNLGWRVAHFAGWVVICADCPQHGQCLQAAISALCMLCML